MTSPTATCGHCQKVISDISKSFIPQRDGASVTHKPNCGHMFHMECVRKIASVMSRGEAFCKICPLPQQSTPQVRAARALPTPPQHTKPEPQPRDVASMPAPNAALRKSLEMNNAHRENIYRQNSATSPIPQSSTPKSQTFQAIVKQQPQAKSQTFAPQSNPPKPTPPVGSLPQSQPIAHRTAIIAGKLNNGRPAPQSSSPVSPPPPPAPQLQPATFTPKPSSGISRSSPEFANELARTAKRYNFGAEDAPVISLPVSSDSPATAVRTSALRVLAGTAVATAIEIATEKMPRFSAEVVSGVLFDGTILATAYELASFAHRNIFQRPASVAQFLRNERPLATRAVVYIATAALSSLI